MLVDLCRWPVPIPRIEAKNNKTTKTNKMPRLRDISPTYNL
jgi:hypothetical protein